MQPPTPPRSAYPTFPASRQAVRVSVRRSWLSQEQKALVLGRLIEQSAEYQAERERIREEANKARAEAAKEQHTVSNPRAGEKKTDVLVEPQLEALPKYSKTENKTSTAKAALLDVSRPAVERAAMLEKNSLRRDDRERRVTGGTG